MSKQRAKVTLSLHFLNDCKLPRASNEQKFLCLCIFFVNSNETSPIIACLTPWPDESGFLRPGASNEEKFISFKQQLDIACLAP
jgi:hypothetical protein